MSCIRLLAGCLTMTLLCGPLAPDTRAQKPGEFVESVFRGFLEAQMERERQAARDRQEELDRHRYPYGKQPPAVPIGPRVPVSPELQTYRTTLGSFAGHSTSLAAGLQRSTAGVRGLQPLMTDVLKLKTTASLLNERARQVNDFALLRQEYGGLDCQWHDLAFQLEQLRGLNSASLASIQQLDLHSDRICRLLGLEPQFDRDAVIRLSVETAAHLDTLLDDVEYELYGLEGSDSLARECRGLAEQCRRLSGIAGGASYDELVTKYSSFVSDWRTFAARLYPFDNAYCDRSVRRIRSCNRRAFERLWTPLSIDRIYLVYLSEQLAREVDSLFDNMTVKSLVQMPAVGQQAVLSTASELYTHCQRYRECVGNNSPLGDLMSDYMQIHDRWTTLDSYLTPVTSPSVVAGRRLVMAYDAELRAILRVPARLDRARLIQLAASLEGLAEHLQYDVRRYGRYYQSLSFRDQAYQSSDAFYAQARNLHSQLQDGASLKNLQATCNGAITTWGSVSKIIGAMPNSGLTSSRYQLISESSQEILPVIAELATTLGV